METGLKVIIRQLSDQFYYFLKQNKYINLFYN